MDNMFIFDKLVALIDKGIALRIFTKEPGKIMISAYKHRELIYSTEYTYDNRSNDQELRDLLHHIIYEIITRGL